MVVSGIVSSGHGFTIVVGGLTIIAAIASWVITGLAAWLYMIFEIYYVMINCTKPDNIMKRKIKTSIAASIITATIFSAALAYSSSFLSSPIPFYTSFYAFAQATHYYN